MDASLAPYEDDEDMKARYWTRLGHEYDVEVFTSAYWIIIYFPTRSITAFCHMGLGHASARLS